MKRFFKIIVFALCCLYCVACTSFTHPSSPVQPAIKNGGMLTQIDTTIPQDGTYRHPYRLEGEEGGSIVCSEWILSIDPYVSPFCASTKLVSRFKKGDFLFILDLSASDMPVHTFQIVSFSTKYPVIQIDYARR